MALALIISEIQALIQTVRQMDRHRQTQLYRICYWFCLRISGPKFKLNINFYVIKSLKIYTILYNSLFYCKVYANFYVNKAHHSGFLILQFYKYLLLFLLSGYPYDISSFSLFTAHLRTCSLLKTGLVASSPHNIIISCISSQLILANNKLS